MWNELRRCNNCRTLYDRTIAFERFLRSDWRSATEPLSDELDPFAARVIDVATRGQTERRRVRLWSRAGFGWATTLAAAGLAIVALWTIVPEDPNGQFMARGNGNPLSIRLLCQTLDTAGRPIIHSYSDDPTTEEVTTCPLPGAFLFAYTSQQPGYLFVFEDTPSRARRYWPVVGENEYLPPTDVQTAIDLVVTGSEDKPRERLLFFLWCSQKEEPARLQKQADAMRRGKPQPDAPCLVDIRQLRFGMMEKSE